MYVNVFTHRCGAIVIYIWLLYHVIMRNSVKAFLNLAAYRLFEVVAHTDKQAYYMRTSTPSRRAHQTLPCLWLLVYCLLLHGCAQPDIGAEIRDNYESSLSELPLSERQHFSLRMYRITGDARYLPAIRADARRDAKALSRDIAQLADPGYRLARATDIVRRYPDDTEKSRLRKALLARSGEIAFAKSLLYDVYQADDLGVVGQPPVSDISMAMDYLRQVDWAGFWLAPGTLRIYAAQSANQIYYLYHLGLVDLRRQLKRAFRDAFPDAIDAQLSELEYENKIYGLTHFIIAHTDYYQHFVQRRQFDWIYAYFETNLEQILRRTKADIYAEVALCFLLAGERKHPVVTRIKRELEARYDAQAEMIPADDNGTDLEHGEHRNTMVIMLYDWPKRLHKGPAIEWQ